MNETDFGFTNETLKNYHACIHQHDDAKDMCCIQAHYANAVGNDMYSFDYDRDFPSRNLIRGVPLISQVSKILSNLFWYEYLKPSIDKILGSRQAILSQEKDLSVTSIYLDTSTSADAERLERFYGRYKNSQCESFRSLMMPCYIFKVQGEGPYAKNGMIPAKVLLGDGVDSLVEIIIPLKVVNDDGKNPVYKLDTSCRINHQLGEVMSALPFYLVGQASNSNIMEVWEIFNTLSSASIKKPYTINLHEMFRYSGIWVKYAWSVPLMNWVFTGGLVCQEEILSTSAFNHLSFDKLPNVYRLYTRDFLISTRNCIKSFYVLLLPQNFPDVDATKEVAKLSMEDVCKFIPSAYEQAYGVMNKNPLYKIFSTTDHYTRIEAIDAGIGILKTFDRIFYAYDLSLCSLIWDKVAYDKKMEKGEVKEMFADIIDEDSDGERVDVPNVEVADYYSFKQLLASYPVLKNNRVLERWILAEPEKAWSLLKRSMKEPGHPDKFAFGQRKRAKLFQTVLEGVMEIPNMTIKRPKRSVKK